MLIYLAILLAFITLHVIADFPLQGEFLANMKGKYDYLLLCHCLIWAGAITGGLLFLGLFEPWKYFFLLGGHFIIDRWKARKEDKTNALTWDLWLDQSLHIAQLSIVIVY